MASPITKQTVVAKQRALTYLNKDFQDFKQSIVNDHIRVYFPQTYSDFNESSLGMMLVEMMAFIGDSFSFYLDKKFSESFIQTAQEKANIYKHARQLGFKAFGKTSAFGNANLMIVVPATTVNQQIVADMRYAGVCYAGTQGKSTGGQTYETLEDADFSNVDPTDSTVCTVAKVDAKTKQPTAFGLMLANVPIKAGQTKTTTFNVGSFTPFLQLTISDVDVLEVLSVYDSLGNQWYETDYLAQDTVFDGVPNNGADATEVPYVLQLRTVPYRFITSYDTSTSKTSLIFGTGDGSALDQDLIPNLGDLSIPTLGKKTFTDFTIDPQNFLRTRTLGLAPINTTLTVTYRVGGGISTNAGATTINKITNGKFDVADNTLATTTIRDVKNSLTISNPLPCQGGRDELSVQELRQIIPANFAAQGRAVNVEDFIARTLSMPSKFGAVFRAFAQPGQVNRNSVELAVLAKDSNDNVALASPTLKQNLQTYLSRFRMITDSIELLDGQIINVGINFSILVSPDYNRSAVLTNCLNAMQSYWNADLWQIGSPINLTDLNYLLADQDGVLSVYQLGVTNLAGFLDGRNYSNTTFNVSKATSNGIVYCPPNAMFTVAFPNKDITGVAK